MKRLLLILLITSAFFGSLIWADSNGVWVRSEDIRPGTFAVDEGYGTFVFEDLTVNATLKVDTIISDTSFEIN